MSVRVKRKIDETLFPVDIKDGWYYVEKKEILVYFDNQNGKGSLKIPRKNLERLLKVKVSK